MSTRPNPLTGPPPPPPGFVLDTGAPPPPPGFVLDAPAPPQPSMRERINSAVASPDPSENRPWYERAAYGVGRGLMAPVNLAREALAPPDSLEEQTAAAQARAMNLPEQAGVIMERMIMRPARQTAEEARKSFEEGKKVRGTRQAVASVIPVAGPMAEAMYQQAVEKGDVAGTAAELATGAYVAARGPKAVKASAELAKRGGQALAKPVTSVVNMLRTPAAEHAMNQAIQPSVTIPRAVESIAKAGPELQRMRAQRGVEIRDTGVKGEAMKAHADNIVETKRAIWDEYEQRLTPYENFYEQTQPVGEAMRKAVDARIRTQYPGVAAKIEKRAATYDKMMTLRQIEEHIQSANNELANWYKKSAADPGSVAPNIAATVAEVQTLRKLLDKKIHSFTGEHVSEFKQLYGALRDVERATARQMFVQARQKGATLYEALAGLTAIGDIIGASPWGAFKAAGKLALGKRLAQLRDADYLIEQAYHGKRAFPEAKGRPGYTAPPAMEPPPPAAPPAGALPGMTFDQPPPGPPPVQVGGVSRPMRALPAPQPPQLGVGRTIPAGPARTGPEPLTPEQMPQPVNVAAAQPQAWPKQASINELRSQSASMKKRAQSMRESAAKMRDATKAQKWVEQADQLEAQAKQIDDAAAARMQPSGEQTVRKPEPPREFLSQEEMAVFKGMPARFGGAGLLTDEIISASGLAPERVGAVLSDLEARGLISRKMGGRFVANVAPDSVAVKPKQPWEMMRDEYARSLTGREVEGSAPRHIGHVRSAIERGEKVPAAVLEEYNRYVEASKPKPAAGPKATFEALTPEEAPRVKYMVDLYKQMDGYGKSSLEEAFGLDRGTWKGLTIEEKLARAFKERKGEGFPSSQDMKEVPF